MKVFFPLALLVLLSPALAAPRQPVPPNGFKSCAAAKQAGYTHMRKGQPGYHTRLDRDRDGVACDKVK